MNPTLRTIGLFAILTAIFMGIGALLLHFYTTYFLTGMLFFFLFITLINIIVYFTGHRIVLWRYNVREVSEKQYPRLHSIVADVAKKAGVPKPKVGIMNSPTPNAFATGRNPKRSIVVVTTRILNILNEEELRGVIAHEMAHIKDRDVLMVTIAAVLASGTALFARWFLWSSMFRRKQNAAGFIIVALALIGAAIATVLIRFAISRQREFKADEVGARTIGDPRPLERALMKLEEANTRWPLRTGNPASSSLFIVNPFRGRMQDLFSTHPPTSKRIKRLQELEPELLGYDLSSAEDNVRSPPYKIK